MIHYMLLFNVKVHFLRTLVKEIQILLNYPILLTYMVVNIDVSFVLSSKGILLCNSPASVLVLNRTSPSLLHTFVVDTLLNFPLPFNIPVILHYTNSSRVNAFGRLLV